ncbi:MAG TPA: aminotransferase class V-fold PLP-dependent enzyme [Vicinamibacterales bacterium]
MLRRAVAVADSFMADLRQREFARLDAENVAYLDYGGAALYADSQIGAHAALLGRMVFGNPHSEHGSSLATTAVIDRVRRRVLRFFDAGDDYTVCFTANASAAIKLVAEAYPFGRGMPFVLAADNHNSVNGVREYARRAGASVHYLPLGDDLRLDDPETRLARVVDLAKGSRPLFAFPAQSNFSGVQHELSLVNTAQSLGCRVLLDAAAFVPSHPLSLRERPADFVAISFYKMFGYPTGVGALITRREALETLTRPWFAGGTVDYASVTLERRQLRELHAGFEDGTPNFLDLAAIEEGFAFVERVGLPRIASHSSELARALEEELASLRHRSGAPLVRFYRGAGPRGATVTFNVLDRHGRSVPFNRVEQRGNAEGVHVRGGCFCNPGAAEAAFAFDASTMAEALDALGRGFSIPRLQQRMGPDVAVGAVRASTGLANNYRDVERCVRVIESFR